MAQRLCIFCSFLSKRLVELDRRGGRGETEAIYSKCPPWLYGIPVDPFPDRKHPGLPSINVSITAATAPDQARLRGGQKEKNRNPRIAGSCRTLGTKPWRQVHHPSWIPSASIRGIFRSHLAVGYSVTTLAQSACRDGVPTRARVPLGKPVAKVGRRRYQ